MGVSEREVEVHTLWERGSEPWQAEFVGMLVVQAGREDCLFLPAEDANADTVATIRHEIEARRGDIDPRENPSGRFSEEWVVRHLCRATEYRLENQSYTWSYRLPSQVFGDIPATPRIADAVMLHDGHTAGSFYGVLLTTRFPIGYALITIWERDGPEAAAALRQLYQERWAAAEQAARAQRAAGPIALAICSAEAAADCHSPLWDDIMAALRTVIPGLKDGPYISIDPASVDTAFIRRVSADTPTPSAEPPSM